MNELKAITIADLVAPVKNALVGGPFGSNLVSKDYVPTGIPVIRGQNMGERWVGGEFVFVSGKKAKELSANVARPGDLIFTQRGTLGQVSIVPEGAFEAYIISQSQMKLTVDQQKADVLFLYYVFQTQEQRDYIVRNAVQAGVPHTNLGHLRTTPLSLPPLPEQRAIAEVLGALDDKIELNRRMNATLETLAKAVFHQWFIDSDNAENWKIGKFNDISRLSRKTITPSQLPDELFYHYSIPAFDDERFPKKDFGIAIMSNKFLMPDVCVLISKLNPKTQRIWIPFQLKGQSICSTEFLINIPKSYFSIEYLYGLFSSQPFQDRFTSMVTGTSSSHQRIKPEYLLDMDIQIPPQKIVLEYTETIQPLMQKVRQNILESRTLANLRDSLLPKLMRGEVRVRPFREQDAPSKT